MQHKKLRSVRTTLRQRRPCTRVSFWTPVFAGRVHGHRFTQPANTSSAYRSSAIAGSSRGIGSGNTVRYIGLQQVQLSKTDSVHRIWLNRDNGTCPKNQNDGCDWRYLRKRFSAVCEVTIANSSKFYTALPAFDKFVLDFWYTALFGCVKQPFETLNYVQFSDFLLQKGLRRVPQSQSSSEIRPALYSCTTVANTDNNSTNHRCLVSEIRDVMKRLGKRAEAKLNGCSSTT